MALSTVSPILPRIGMGKLGRLGLEPAQRYERERPRELMHVDVKKLGRILVSGHRVTGNRRRRATKKRYGAQVRGTAGWEFVHIAVDHATRLAYASKSSTTRTPPPRPRSSGAPCASSARMASPSRQ